MATTSPLQAALSEETEEVIILMRTSKDINAVTPKGLSLLHLCVVHNMSDSVEHLLTAGIDANIAGADGITPLHFAAVTGNKPIVERLVRHGADLNREMANLPGAGVCRELLMQREWDADAYRLRPLMLAAHYGHLEIVVWLITAGAEVDHFRDTTALQLAVCHPGGAPVVKVLLDAGASVNLADVNDLTALHHAVLYQAEPDAETVRLLLEAGASVDAIDDLGRTPLDLLLEPDEWLLADTGKRLQIMEMLVHAYGGSLPTERLLLVTAGFAELMDDDESPSMASESLVSCFVQWLGRVHDADMMHVLWERFRSASSHNCARKLAQALGHELDEVREREAYGLLRSAQLLCIEVKSSDRCHDGACRIKDALQQGTKAIDLGLGMVLWLANGGPMPAQVPGLLLSAASQGRLDVIMQALCEWGDELVPPETRVQALVAALQQGHAQVFGRLAAAWGCDRRVMAGLMQHVAGPTVMTALYDCLKVTNLECERASASAEARARELVFEAIQLLVQLDVAKQKRS